MEYTFSQPMADLKPSAIREIFKVLSDPSIISFAAGNPAPESFPANELSLISAKLWADAPTAVLQYGLTEGYAPLRGLLTDRLKTVYQIGAANDTVIMVSGAQQGIQLAAMVLCDRGDTILCENPSFIGSLNAFRALGLNLYGLDMDEDGILPESLEHALKTQKNIKALYTIPTFQNPTSITMSLARRRTVLALCEQYGVVIIEDNPYGDLAYDGTPPPTIKSMDQSGTVVYVGSFSKVIAPGLRLGYVCGPAPIVEKMVVAKQGEDVHSTQFSQMLVYEYLRQYDLDTHIAKCCGLYRVKRDIMWQACMAAMSHGADILKPAGGLFLWCFLKNTDNSADFCQAALAHKVAVVPGTAFLTDPKGISHGFRLNFSLPTEEQIATGTKILGGLL